MRPVRMAMAMRPVHMVMRPRGAAGAALRALLLLAAFSVAGGADGSDEDGVEGGAGGEGRQLQTECRGAAAAADRAVPADRSVRVCAAGGGGAVRAAAGRTATIACTLINPGTHTVSWVRSRDLRIVAHAGVAFAADARVSAAEIHDGDAVRHTLTISALRPADAGRYECQVNTEPKIALHFDLIIEDETPQVEVKAWQESGRVGGGAGVLMCRASAARGAAVAVRWARTGGALPGGGTARDTRLWPGGAQSRLEVAAGRGRSGPYECHATLADRADDAADSAAVAIVVLRFDDFEDSEEASAAEAMQGDEWAARARARARSGATHCGPLPLPLPLLLSLWPLLMLLLQS